MYLKKITTGAIAQRELAAQGVEIPNVKTTSLSSTLEPKVPFEATLPVVKIKTCTKFSSTRILTDSHRSFQLSQLRTSC
jgi:hypothetical protein